ncbi:MAG: hypothetical protein AUJ12_07155 [Alphaproteobacteria bacterium CG1_02_46_17]|nr:MAG: hypothetical protein AUJ12_07155 [Alphaproteobacteria bacterium CG1_02_46_17]
MRSEANKTFVTVRDFILPARIGIYESEHLAPQRICVSISMELDNFKVSHDRIEDTVSYEGIVMEIRRLADVHHELVETLAEHLAQYCLNDVRVSCVEVAIEKLDIFIEGIVGARVIRTASDLTV